MPKSSKNSNRISRDATGNEGGVGGLLLKICEILILNKS